MRILQLRRKNDDSCAWCTRGEPSTLVCLVLMSDGFLKKHELSQRERVDTEFLGRGIKSGWGTCGV